MSENLLVNKRTLAATLLMVVCCLSAHADIISYGDSLAGTGESIDYLNITEDASVNTNGAGLFGPPSRNGDLLSFNPSGFDTGAVVGPGSNLIDSHLEMDIQVASHALPGGLSTINISEFGDYTVVGNGDVSASINWFLTIPGASGIAAGTSSFAATSGTGAWQLDVELDLANGTYNAGGGAMPLVDANGNAITLPSGLIPSATLEFDNTLSGTAQDLTSAAFIKKKGVDGIDVTIGIPEPGAFAMSLFGFLGLIGVSRRRRVA